MSLRCKLSLLLFCLSVSFAAWAQPSGGAIVRGVVADPTGAVIPGATVTLTPGTGKALLTTSGADGTYTLRDVPPGMYSVTVTISGFASFVRTGVRIAPAQQMVINAKLAIQQQSTEVQVNAQATQLSVDPDSNASATTIKGKDLDALADDPDELSSELTALAGPSAGPNGGQIYVDGFTGGQLPPKSSIREIRINRNPFSAEYDRLGFGRVEVFTKPGTDKLHGNYQIDGNDSSFNTGNPVLNRFLSPGQTPISQPGYHTIFMFGSITGSLTPKASFTLSGSHRNIQDNSIFNGTILTPAGNAGDNGSAAICPVATPGCVIQQLQTATTAPRVRTEFSPRLDLALSNSNTLTVRYQYEQNDEINNGLGSFSLPSTAYNSNSNENELQVSDTQVVSPRLINETRFEYRRNRSADVAQSTAPTVTVQNAFTTGGSSGGTSSDHGDYFEVQNYTSLQLKSNFIRFGGRLRSARDANNTSARTNGVFSYSSLAAYQANNVQNFTLTRINVPKVEAWMSDLGVYAETDWKAKPNLTISYGLRYETQNHISEHHDLAPRVSFAYGLGTSKGAPKTVLRGGFGIFYDRFDLGNILTTYRQNGIVQTQLTLSNIGTTGCSPLNISACYTGGSFTNNTTYTQSPRLRTPYTMQSAIGLDLQPFRGATVSVNYLNAVGVHEFLSQNTAAIGRPYSSTTTGLPVTYQFQSEGVFRQNQIHANFNIRRRRVSLFGFYSLNFAKADTNGAGYFPSKPGNIGADYGRANFDVRNRLFLGGSINLPKLITLNPFVIAQSGQPYNITTGQDLNGDSIVNDRPVFLPGQNSASCTNATSFGIPAAGTNYTPIPINYCSGPNLFTFNLRATKTIGFGPKIVRESRGGQEGGGGPGEGRRGGGGRGFGIGGSGTSSGRRYNLTLGAQLRNVFNNADLSPPVGVLTSPNFGQSLQLANGPFTSNAAVQRLQLQASVSF